MKFWFTVYKREHDPPVAISGSTGSTISGKAVDNIHGTSMAKQQVRFETSKASPLGGFLEVQFHFKVDYVYII